MSVNETQYEFKYLDSQCGEADKHERRTSSVGEIDDECHYCSNEEKYIKDAPQLVYLSHLTLNSVRS